MRWLDHEVPRTGGRSVRELIILTGGLALTIGELVRPGGPDVGNWLVYAGATALFGVRFYLARAVAVGACVGAIAQQWPYLRGGLEHASLETLAVFPVAAIALLASRDLVARFEGGASRHRLLPNPWRAFTSAQTRTLRASCYAAGALAGLLDHAVYAASGSGAPLGARAAMIGIIASIAALSLGHAVGLLGIWILGVVVAVSLAPRLLATDPLFGGDPHAVSSVGALGYAVEERYLLAMVILAVASAAIATPFTARLLRRALR
ncbi:MAG: hypothetical protein R3A79_11010 [Nannocystaceae bacterium]